MQIEPLAVPAGARVLGVLPRLALALEGGHPVAPYAVGSPPPGLPPHVDGDLPSDLAVVVGTSGSTGAPKRAMLTTGNLLASIEATATRTGGHGQWLATLPGHHIAGLQVLLRSLVAGTTPHVMDPGDGFTPATWVAAVDAMPSTDRPTHVSIVPTQLVRLLADPAATQRLARFTSVLVGGSATHPDLIARATDAGVSALTTYGMSETAGGCVYSGRPLDGTSVSFDADGRIHLTGPTVAHGYLGDPARTATHFPLIARSADRERSERSAERAISGSISGSGAQQQVFVTDDVGHLDADGLLHVDGRIDDLINTGGLKVAPRLVEEAVTRLDGIAEAVAVGLTDPEWGQVIAVAIVRTPARASRPADPAAAANPAGTDHPLTVSDLRSALDGILPRHALPRAVREVAAIPARGPGKPNRAAVRALFDTVGE